MVKEAENSNKSSLTQNTLDVPDINVGGTVSRQAAIAAVLSVIPYDEYWKEQVEIAVNNLPSAQPNLQPTCNQLATDAISRQAAIDATWKEPSYTDPLNVLTEVRDRIKALPPVQPEPSIPISWIEKHIDWLKSMDNGFSNIAAMNISVFVKKWRKENGKDDGSD